MDTSPHLVQAFSRTRIQGIMSCDLRRHITAFLKHHICRNIVKLMQLTHMGLRWLLRREEDVRQLKLLSGTESTAKQTIPTLPRKNPVPLRLTSVGYPMSTTTGSVVLGENNALEKLLQASSNTAVGKVATTPEDTRISADQTRAVESSRCPRATLVSLETRGESVVEALEARHLINRMILPCNDKEDSRGSKQLQEAASIGISEQALEATTEMEENESNSTNMCL